MRVPDGAAGCGGADGPPDDLPLRPCTAREGWRGWAGDVVAVVRRSWRAIAEILLVTMVLPLLPLSGLVADGAYLGAVKSGARAQIAGVAIAAFGAPALLALAAGCGLVVARGWTGAVWAVASAGSGRPAGLREALRWSRRRSGLLWGFYLAGVVVLTGGAFLAGYMAPFSTVPRLLALAGPAGLLAPVLCFAPLAARRRPAPAPSDPPPGGLAPAATRRSACLMPMALVLAVVVGCEVAAALALSWLMTPAPGAFSARISAPAAALLASLVALPGSVLLAAASSVSYARLRGQAERPPGGLIHRDRRRPPGEHVRIEVRDDGGPWIPPATNTDRPHGLDLIRAFATRWGVTGTDAGRIVWAQLDWPAP